VEFSSVTEGDSREGENEGAIAQKEVIVGTILCPMDRTETQDVVEDNGVDMRNGDHEGEEVIADENEDEIVGDGSEEAIDEGS
jgi:E3 ubiquitin-protein ligase DOA10